MRHHIEKLVRAALDEDAPWGDISSQTFIPSAASVQAQLVAREPGVFSGSLLIDASFHLLDPTIDVSLSVGDGEKFSAGDVLGTITGNARAILQGERIALNFCQRMSGIATLTSTYVAEVAGTKARIVDTRKTTPGLRLVERQAVRDGGGFNHRTTLSDAVMLKDNHLAIIEASGQSITDALTTLKATLPHTTRVEVEVDRIEQIEPILAAGVDTIMLDNFTIEELIEGVELIGGRAIVEASGGVNLNTVAKIAATGVDVISVGALTHSVRALDLGLDIT
ncbi:putative nicotinate-nucleotide pyrophosphorylase [carboxylating] [Corynebacterium deserti GIMN1.010]|uniref:Nicotinate-nucleotide pyrophosphorylase [carboxylating] n=1 Tax=Corynebacterium deserti GIMN1.010 TaxID=931089 RepID=A0A0M5ILG1_9CORY|nr:carboxylating nicotinate-nucleotide diphosphorylase [Corynebacterium deserti]ALC05468.1 putative nicotinate-nucleotide pyrophosphorylase [carboxylating] [Corynebacterium deserti GIMN1.010]